MIIVDIIEKIIDLIVIVLNRYEIPVNDSSVQLSYLMILLLSIIPIFLVFDFLLRKVERKLKKN